MSVPDVRGGAKTRQLSRIAKCRQWVARLLSLKTIALLLVVLLVSVIVSSFSRSSPDIVSASTLGDGFVAYGAGGNTTPQSRIYSGSSNSFGSASGTVAGAAPLVVQTRTSPSRAEAITGYVNSGGTLQIMCYNGLNWSNEWSVGVGGSGSTQRFDIAYETNSGDVMVLYSTNTGTTNELAYRTKPGSSGCGSANWASAASLNPIRSSGVVHWVKMAWDARSSSDLITAIWADSNRDLSAMQWSGSAWGNEPGAALDTNLEVDSSAQDLESFDLAYESQSGDVMIGWTNETGGGTTSKYKVCTGGTAACSWGTTANIWGNIKGASNLNMAANPNTNEIVMGSVDGYVGGTDLYIGYWTGSAFTGPTAILDSSTTTTAPGTMLVAAGWLTAGGTTRSVVVYNDSSATNIGWYVGNGSTFTKQTDVTPTPAFANPQKYYDIQMDPLNQDRLMFTLSDNGNDLFAKRLTMTSGAAFAWTNADSSSALETTLGQAVVGDFSFAYWRSPPAFEQAAYRWYNNADSVQPGSALANENTPASITSRSALLRLRAVLTNVGTDLSANTQGFKLQYAASTSGPWSNVSGADAWCNDTSGITCTTDWQNRRKVTFDNSASGTNLTGFPVLIQLDSSTIDYSKTQGNGEDIRFVDPDNPALVLSHEVEKWDEGGTSLVWVKVPQVNASSTTDYVWMYYNNATIGSGQDVANTWDANYKAVWHLKENPATTCSGANEICDSTSAAHHGNMNGAMTAADQVPGQVDGSIDFDGSDDFFDTGDISEINGVNKATFSAWIKRRTTGSMVLNLKQVGGHDFGIEAWSDGLVYLAVSNGTNVAGTFASNDTNWHLVTFVYDGTQATNATKLLGYLDGVQQTLSFIGTIPSTTTNNTTPFMIGRDGAAGGARTNGFTDEIRISNTNRSADWVRAEHKTMTGAFTSYSAEESQGGGGNSLWQFKDNPTPADGAIITTSLLSGSPQRQSYEESNPSANNPTAMTTGQKGEWDFTLDPAHLCSGVYYFRLVKADETPLTTYGVYPQITVDVTAPLNQAMRHGAWFKDETKQSYSCDWVQ